jgi:hypothetical protein
MVEVKTMAKAAKRSWFENCGAWTPGHDLNDLRAGIEAGLLNEQDEYGMTALHLATSSKSLQVLLSTSRKNHVC